MTNQDVVNKLIGKIQPIGESHNDEIRFKNLEAMTHLITGLIQDVDRVAYENRDRTEHSMKKAGEFAQKFLDNIKD